ncbi:MAG: hypothetical protein DMF53_27185 [Acidobacteria bacterium]|nr:MAG: hypothetical protein DMF53_27185 [Acidobacteriota bacterium]
MSCPDWTRLVALREGADAEPAGWAEAMAHLDACPRCRREAVAADPLLVFRRLPAVDMTEGDERAEAESMRQAVASMRTARRLESRQRFAGWRRWAAAAVLAIASLAVSWDKAPRPRPEPATLPSSSTAAIPVPAAGSATLEPLDGSDARVYQMNGQGVTAFMIVDHKLDV